MKQIVIQVEFGDNSNIGSLTITRDDEGSGPFVRVAVVDDFAFEKPKEVDQFAKAVKELLKP